MKKIKQKEFHLTPFTICGKILFCSFIYLVINAIAYGITLLTTKVGCCVGGAYVCFFFFKKWGCVHLALSASEFGWTCPCLLKTIQNPIIVCLIVIILFIFLFKLAKKKIIKHSWKVYFLISGLIMIIPFLFSLFFGD